MRSSRPDSGPPVSDAALAAFVAVLVRLPFLLRADRFFDSDEAVEGLMARHLWRGEWPVYLWGQHYKGVPEVYLTAVLFRVGGSSVFLLKAATLACFATFVALQFLLVGRLFSRRVAWLSVAFTLVCPPALVLWSLSGNAEIVMTLLAGAVAGIGIERWQRTGSTGGLLISGAAVAFGLWVQQYIVYYVVAAAATWALSAPRHALANVVRAPDRPFWIRMLVAILLVVAAAYAALGAASFLSGGFTIPVGARTIGLTHPQKLWRIAGALALAAALFRWSAWWMAGLALGYLPALLGVIAGQWGSTPIGRVDAAQLGHQLYETADLLVPVLLGFRTPTLEPLPGAVWAVAIILIVVAASCLAIRAGGRTRYFHVFLIVVPVIFLASGAYVDAQSYRYLMPVYAALPVVYAVGIDDLVHRHPAIGSAVAAALVAVFLVQQVGWYQRLRPDNEADELVRCLTERGVTTARADYWISYKITFLTGERVIVAPSNGVDRYLPYREQTRGPGTAQLCKSPSGTMTCCS